MLDSKNKIFNYTMSSANYPQIAIVRQIVDVNATAQVLANVALNAPQVTINPIRDVAGGTKNLTLTPGLWVLNSYGLITFGATVTTINVMYTGIQEVVGAAGTAFVSSNTIALAGYDADGVGANVDLQSPTSTLVYVFPGTTRTFRLVVKYTGMPVGVATVSTGCSLSATRISTEPIVSDFIA